jgi:hypothetical protein
VQIINPKRNEDETAFESESFQSGLSKIIKKVDDIAADSIKKIVDEILEDIGDIFIRAKLFTHECEMILAILRERIKKYS